MKKWIIAILVVGIIFLSFMSSYNSLVINAENVNGKWSQVENQLQRRTDLIPNLVETVKGFAAQEKSIFTEVADARAKLAGAQTVGEAAEANQAVTGALGRLLAIVENYPQLKSDANFRALQDELAGTENRLATARKDYNDAVQVYNANIKRFPTMIYAKMFSFAPSEYFQTTEEAKNAPKVSF